MKTRTKTSKRFLSADDISQSTVVIHIKMSSTDELTVHCISEQEAKQLSKRLQRFVTSHQVAANYEAIKAAVQTCAAIKVI